jgi:hypothetical protein
MPEAIVGYSPGLVDRGPKFYISPHIRRRTSLTAKFPTGVSYAGLQSKSDEDFHGV